MRPVLLALALLGCAHTDLMRAGATPSPLPSDGASASIHNEHGARAPERAERVRLAPADPPMLRLRVSHRGTATAGLTHDPSVDKRVLRRLREPTEPLLRLPVSLTDLAIDAPVPRPPIDDARW